MNEGERGQKIEIDSLCTRCPKIDQTSLLTYTYRAFNRIRNIEIHEIKIKKIIND